MSADINVTSLIDLAFTLLIIFIITAPVLQGGVEVKLPEAQVRPVTSQEDPFIVIVSADGEIFIGETEFSADEFEELFPELFASAEPSIVYIRGDTDAIYGAMYRVIVAVGNVTQEAGASFALVGEPEPQGR